MSRRKNASLLAVPVLLLVAFFTVAFASTAFGQVTPGVKANFGVEGDMYADTTQFGGLGVGLTTDDWFDKRSGTGFEGIGVIDTTGAWAFRQLIMAGGAAANQTFVRRMAFPYSSVVNGHLLFDAVYARDNHATQSSQDSSVFTGTKDKNSDNPVTWNLGTNGTPQKNDLVDGFAHMRYDGPSVDDSLWLFVASSTISSDGDAHNDYEFFREADSLLPGASQLTGTGPDSGHTAWRVVSGALQAGDLILSIDFENGGENPIPTLRLWIEEGTEAEIEAYSDFVFTGVFSGGGQSAGPFGYAEIEIPPGAIYARVNGLASDPPPRATLAAPWGSLEGPKATFEDSVLALQFAEAGINLTAMGLDQSTTGDPCANLFGYILFKTRSSQSFTAELKDFIGPFAFGQVVDVLLELDSTDVTCYGYNDGEVTATFSGGFEPYRINIDDGAWVDPATSPYTFTGLAPGSHTVIVEDMLGCADTNSTVVVEPPDVVLSLDSTDVTCYGYSDGVVTATFSGGIPPYRVRINGGAWVDPATSPYDFTGLAAGSYTVDVQDANNCEETASISVYQPPDVVLSLDSTDVTCYGYSDGVVTATFSGGIPPYRVRINGGAWVDPATSPYDFTGLAAGSYTVDVQDANNCEESASKTLIDPPELTCTVSPAETTVCSGEPAHFCVLPDGGTPPYNFYWEGPGFTSPESCITVFDGGTYMVTVEDAHYCSTQCEAVLIAEPCGCTFTMGGWGSDCPGPQQGDRYSTQPGCILDHFFDQVFPDGVWIGNPAAIVLTSTGTTSTNTGTELMGDPAATEQPGVDAVPPAQTPSSTLTNGWYWLRWTSSSAVKAFLRSGGGPALVLTENLTNPESAPTTTGNLGRQLLALRLNVEFTCAGVFDSVGMVTGDYCYGDFLITNECGKGKFDGMSVYTFLAIADSAVGGLDVLGHYGATYSDLIPTATCLNELFDDCDPTRDWELQTASGSGAKSYSDADESGAQPKEFSLSQNYPNPFNPVCEIQYGLPTDCRVTLSIYNILGQRVKVLVNEHQSPGYKSVRWDGKNDVGNELSSGVYFYRIEAGDFVQVKKMLLIK